MFETEVWSLAPLQGRGDAAGSRGNAVQAGRAAVYNVVIN